MSAVVGRRAAATGGGSGSFPSSSDVSEGGGGEATYLDRSKKSKKKGTPPFVYLFLLIPIGGFLFAITAGKDTRQQDDLQSFAPPPGGTIPANIRRRQETIMANSPLSDQPEGASSLRLDQDHNDEVQLPMTTPKQPTTTETTTSTETTSLSTTATGTTTSSSSRRILKLSEGLVRSPNTVVTAYVNLKSKFDKSQYLKWMGNMLSMQDAMVIFTSDDMVDIIKSRRSHAADRTVIVVLDKSLADLQLVQKYPDESFWQKQLDSDPEKRIHRSYQLFWIWLSKTWFVTEAMKLDFFGSDVYMWSDIGCFRNGRYNDKQIIQHRELIPQDRILQMAHHPPYPPPYVWWNDKYHNKPMFYHSGSQMVGYRSTWDTFHQQVMVTIEGFLERHMFIGEDQTVLQSTCLREPLCAYVPQDQVQDNHYFGLRYVLHYGGDNYQLFYPPTNLPAEKSSVPQEEIDRQLQAIRDKTAKVQLNFHLA